MLRSVNRGMLATSLFHICANSAGEAMQPAQSPFPVTRTAGGHLVRDGKQVAYTSALGMSPLFPPLSPTQSVVDTFQECAMVVTYLNVADMDTNVSW